MIHFLCLDRRWVSVIFTTLHLLYSTENHNDALFLDHKRMGLASVLILDSRSSHRGIFSITFAPICLIIRPAWYGEPENGRMSLEVSSTWCLADIVRPGLSLNMVPNRNYGNWSLCALYLWGVDNSLCRSSASFVLFSRSACQWLSTFRSGFTWASMWTALILSYNDGIWKYEERSSTYCIWSEKGGYNVAIR